MSAGRSLVLPEWFAIPSDALVARSPMRLRILADSAALHGDLAHAIAEEISANHEAGRPTRLILPVGPIRQYATLAELCNQRRISWRTSHIFLMDEYCDWQGRRVAPEHPLSFRGFFEREFVQLLDEELRPNPEQVYLPDPRRLDEVSELIEAVGGIDTCYGGIGIHGHVAFNEPPLGPWHSVSAAEFRNSAARLVTLNPETVVMNASRALGGYLPALPPMAVTLGMHDIFAARRIRLYCQGGSWQRAILRIALFGCPNPRGTRDNGGDDGMEAGEDVRYPVTLLRGHADLEFATDLETAQPVTARQNA